MSRTRTALSATVKQFARTPVLLALLVVLPAYFVGVVGAVIPDTPVALHVPGVQGRAPLVDAILAMMAPLAATIVGGIAGLFLTVNTLDADAWLSLAGLPARTLFAARAGALAAASVVASLGATAMLLVHFAPEQPAVFVGATVLLAVTYGLFGAVAGVVVDRLGGVYAMLFAPTIDLFLLHSPLATEAPEWGVLAPGRWAGVAAMDAAFTGDPNWDALGVGVAYLGVAAVGAGLAIRHAVRAN